MPSTTVPGTASATALNAHFAVPAVAPARGQGWSCCTNCSAPPTTSASRPTGWPPPDSCQELSAEDAWARVLRLFDRHLRA